MLLPMLRPGPSHSCEMTCSRIKMVRDEAELSRSQNWDCDLLNLKAKCQMKGEDSCISEGGELLELSAS